MARAVPLLGTTVADGAGQPRVFAPREPFGNIGGQDEVGLRTKEAAGRMGCQRGRHQPPNRRAAGEGWQDPLHSQFLGTVPPLGLILKALLRRETWIAKATSWALWGLFQECLGMKFCSH